MSNFKETTLTTKGNDLLLKVILGQCKLEFTRLAVGDGEPEDENFKALTGLVSEKMESTVVDKKILDDGFCSITGRFTNEGIDELIMVKELGVYALDPDEGEILYSYTIAEGNANYFAPSKTTVLEEYYSPIIYISTLTDKQIVWNIVAVRNAKEVEFDNRGTHIISDNVDGALRELDSRSKPSNFVAEIAHDLNRYPQVLAMVVKRGYGKGTTDDEIDDTGLSYYIATRYLSKDSINIYVAEDMKYSDPEVSKVNDNHFVVNFSDTDKSLNIILI